MMIYLKPNSKRWQKKMLARGVLVLLVLAILFALNIYPPDFLRRPLVSLATPFWQIQDWGANLLKTIFTPFADKNKLSKENTALKTELERKKLVLMALEDLAVENQELKELGGRKLQGTFILAAILSRPPVSAYDTLIIDVGSNEGIAVGDIAAVQENSVGGGWPGLSKNPPPSFPFPHPERARPEWGWFSPAPHPGRAAGAAA